MLVDEFYSPLRMPTRIGPQKTTKFINRRIQISSDSSISICLYQKPLQNILKLSSNYLQKSRKWRKDAQKRKNQRYGFLRNATNLMSSRVILSQISSLRSSLFLRRPFAFSRVGGPLNSVAWLRSITPQKPRDKDTIMFSPLRKRFLSSQAAA